MNAKTLAKKFAALSMAAALAFSGAPLAAYADSVTSSGTNNGHLDLAKTLVTLPTITEKDVAYTVDPERLINKTVSGTTGTDGEGNLVTPNAAGVYFLGNEADVKSGSAAFPILNVGTKDVKVTVSVENKSTGTGVMALTDNAVDLSAIDTSVAPTTDAAVLYMDLIADTFAPNNGTATASTSGSTARFNCPVVTTASVEMVISGNPANYEVQTSAAGGYTYGRKANVTTITNKAAGFWAYGEFSLKGTASYASAKELEAPQLVVTWSVDPTAANEDNSTTIASADGNEVIAGDLFDYQGVWYLCKDGSNSNDVKGIECEASDVTGVTVNGKALGGTGATYNVTNDDRGTFVEVPWTSVKAVGEGDDDTLVPGHQWKFEVLLKGGKKSVCTYTYPSGN